METRAWNQKCMNATLHLEIAVWVNFDRLISAWHSSVAGGACMVRWREFFQFLVREMLFRFLIKNHMKKLSSKILLKWYLVKDFFQKGCKMIPRKGLGLGGPKKTPLRVAHPVTSYSGLAFPGFYVCACACTHVRVCVRVHVRFRWCVSIKKMCQKSW